MPWINEDSLEEQTIDLPSIDQYQQEINNRTETVNELEKQIKNLKVVKESLIAETHKIFKETEARLDERERKSTEALKINEELQASLLSKIEAVDKQRDGLIEDIHIFNKDKESFQFELIGKQEDLNNLSRKLNSQQEEINFFKKQADEMFLALSIKKQEIEKQFLSLENKRKDVESQITALETKQDEIFKRGTLVSERELTVKDELNDIMQISLEIADKHSKTKQMEDNILLLRKDLEIREQKLRDESLDNATIRLQNEERLDFLHQEENRINEKMNRLTDLQNKIEKSLTKEK